ncbi:MAG: carboxypeptidase regulatory-like domain-containing protein [Calditrichaeota bacterium]|nr:carboxypeptidase regulatory-like domain-containing protein [Calditrichota bacterium]
MKLGLLCLLLVSAVFAGPGKIVGNVRDANRNGLVGATVRIIETDQVIAVTNLDGSFVILGVKPGVYTVRVSCEGRIPYEIEAVAVAEDYTTDLYARLVEQSKWPYVSVLRQKWQPPRVHMSHRIFVCWPRLEKSKPNLPAEYTVEPRYRHYLTQPSGRDVF